MKLSLENNAYIVRDTGKFVEGRMKVFLHDTDILADIYTLEGPDFVQAQNPQLLHAGLPDESLFAETDIYDITIEQYIGPEGAMSVDSPDEQFRQVDEFEFGLDFNIGSLSTARVDTVSDLRKVDPSLGVVDVLWYAEQGDCVPRRYVWDAASMNDEDGGYVIGSDISDTGRWILLWEDEILPSCIYGVVAGVNESNINLLLNYPTVVGSFQLVTAPMVRFLPGTYTSNVDFSTTKGLLFDRGAQFTYSKFTCSSAATLGGNTSYVADFKFTNPDSPAHSSMFRSLSAFWKSGSNFLYLDGAEYMTVKNLSGKIDLTGKNIFGTAWIAPTYSTGCYFYVENTTVDYRLFSPANDFVYVNDTSVGDRIFKPGTFDPGPISAGHHVQYGMAPSLDTFVNTANWVRVMVEMKSRYGSTMTDMLDFQGRFLDACMPTGFKDIRNLHCDDLSLICEGEDIVVHNVYCERIGAACRYLTIYDSRVNFHDDPNISGLWAYGSTVTSDNAFTVTSLPCQFYDSTVGISFNRVTENENPEAMLWFSKCRIQENVVINTKTLYMFGCITENNTIKIYPFKVEGTYHLFVRLCDNMFNNGQPIEFRKVDLIDGHRDEDCYGILLDWEIVGNNFTGNDDGLKMRFWQFRAGNHGERTFVDLAGTHHVVYSGNTGNCPGSNLKGLEVTDNSDYTTETVTGAGGNTLTLYKYGNNTGRAMPIVQYGFWWYVNTPDNDMLIKWYNRQTYPGTANVDQLGYDVFTQTGFVYWFKAHDDDAYDGDFFELAVGTGSDYIRIVQGGSDDHNSDVVARVV